MIRVLFSHLLPFVLGSVIGIAAFYVVMPIDVPAPQNASDLGSGSSSGTASGRRTTKVTIPDTFEAHYGTSPFVIVSKPRATYTDAARHNGTEGSVLLKVTLLASGDVGGISVIRGLPDGLTERAIDAARQIEFVPKRVDGRPISVTQTFEYTFEIY